MSNNTFTKDLKRNTVAAFNDVAMVAIAAFACTTTGMPANYCIENANNVSDVVASLGNKYLSVPPHSSKHSPF